MRRIFILLVLAILMQACSGVPFLNPSVNAPADTSTPTMRLPTTTVTSTATIMPTVSPTTTIVHFPTQDPDQPTATPVIIPIFVDGKTITPIARPTAYLGGLRFISVDISDKKIFWGNCKFNHTKITARVDDPDQVYSVVIFVRVKALKKEDYTPWTTGDVMHDHRNGSYSYTLYGSNIEGHNHYKESWVFFQLVATNDAGDAIGRTIIYTNSISLSPCM